jgi:hypothetical protein
MNGADRSPEKDFAMSTPSDRSMLPRRQFLRRMAGTTGGLLVTAVAAACGANKASSASQAATSSAATTTGAPATAAATPSTAKAATATTVAVAPAPAPTTAAKATAPAGAVGAAAGAAFDAAKELAISFSYVADTTAGGNPPGGGGGGGGKGGGLKNPYVVVWIENAAGVPVRSISLNYQAGRGEQYLRDLTRWARTAQASAAVATISSATKVPGAYKIVWDGNDDKKAPVAQGDYFVCIEAAREHGPYEIVREQISIGAESFVKPLAAKGELQDVTVELRARS